MLLTFDAAVQSAVQSKVDAVMAGPSSCYVCPITHEMFRNPVMAEDGHTYEKCAILKHFASSSNPTRSPMTNNVLSGTRLTENHQCKCAVDTYKASVQNEMSLLVPLCLHYDVDMCERLIERAKEICDFDQLQERDWQILILKHRAMHSSPVDAFWAFAKLFELDHDLALKYASDMPSDRLEDMHECRSAVQVPNKVKSCIAVSVLQKKVSSLSTFLLNADPVRHEHLQDVDECIERVSKALTDHEEEEEEEEEDIDFDLFG
eukprot:TRINITY_DN76188_c0_g1_i1.p1 TRINITY_DN76188_c0_g1~~TRINITY_DN76188_c0_g1_i1.p1  ORF type:complete len:276 (-),score=33.20 TRINITY_DN76188_c0_g1_i1:29-814(-)